MVFALFFSFSALFILLSRGAFISMFVITGLFLIMKTKRRTIPRSISLFSIIIISSVLVQTTILDNNLISERSAIIASYALCGFANFGSIGIQLGGIGAMAPEKRNILSKIVLKAMVGGALASWLTATIAGILI